MKKYLKYIIPATALVLVLLVAALIGFGWGGSEGMGDKDPFTTGNATTDSVAAGDGIGSTALPDSGSPTTSDPSPEESKSSSQSTGSTETDQGTEQGEAPITGTKPSGSSTTTTEPPATAPKDSSLNDLQPPEPDRTEDYSTESDSSASVPSVTEPAESDSSNETYRETEGPIEVPTEVNIEDYEKFLKMSPDEQQVFVAAFTDIEAFFDWYNAVKDAYDKANPSIDVGDGTVNIGDIIDDKG